MIIPGFNIFIYKQAHLLFCNRLCAINQFCFKRLKKAFCNCIVPAITFTTHALFRIKRLQNIDCLFTCILGTPIRTKNRILSKSPVPVCHPYSRDYSFRCTHVIADRPSYEFTVKKIQNTSQIKESIQERDIHQVRCASFNRFFIFKNPVEQVWGYLKIMRRVCSNFKPSGKFTTQSHSFDMDGNSTHHINRPSFRVVVFNKLKDQRLLLEMMPKAFFNMSRSISASFKRFSSSTIPLLSSLRDWMPLPEKLESPFSSSSLHHRYNKNGFIPNSFASSDTFLHSKLNLTAFSLNALSKCKRCFLITHKSKLLCLTPCPIQVSNSNFVMQHNI